MIFDLPEWMHEAHKWVGTAEIPGAKTSSTILSWLTKLKAWWRDDETPWCGVFVAHCFQHWGMTALPKTWMRAISWSSWGKEVTPAYGAVLVFKRKGGGHVGFYVKEDATRYYVLGGNQGNKVSIVPIEKARCVGVRWPANRAYLPNRVWVKGSGEEASQNEA